MRELSMIEVQEVAGATNWTAVGQGAILVGAGALAIATGGFALLAVGTIATVAGGTWASYGLTAPAPAPAPPP